MDNRVILAVAGSGKTTHIINKLTLNSRYLILTYTNNNFENLRLGIIKKFGFFPQNISLMTYFSFVHSFCYLPFLKDEYDTVGVLFKPNQNRFAKGKDRFISKGGRLYSNRISKYIVDQGLVKSILSRIERYYDQLFIDEVQDFAGHDFNFISCLSKLKIQQIYVGDFYQHTFDTSRDGSVNKNLHTDFTKYKEIFKVNGFYVDEETLSNSYRCTPSVCKYVSDNLGINIKSHKKEKSSILFIDNKDEIRSYLLDKNIIKLFYQKHYLYSNYSRNWGDSKGENNYKDICISLNAATLKKYKTNDLINMPEQSKNKLYVALTRANKNVYLVPEILIKQIVHKDGIIL